MSVSNEKRIFSEAVVNKGSWLTHNGKKIWFADYSGLRREEFIQVAYDTHLQFIKDMQDEPPKSGLILTDVSGSVIDSLVYTTLRDTGLAVAPFVKRTAVLGVTGIKLSFLNMAIYFTGITMRAFDTRKDALDWLIL
jgi:hypothetical protein